MHPCVEHSPPRVDGCVRRESRWRRPALLSATVALSALLLVLPLARAAGSSGRAKARTATASHAAHAAPAPTVAGQVKASGARLPDSQDVITFLGQVIDWYRHLPDEERLVSEPAETLYVADDRQMAHQVGQLAFAFARAQAALLATVGHPSTAAKASASGNSSVTAQGTASVAELGKIQGQANAQVTQARQRIAELTTELRHARRSALAGLKAQLAIAQGSLELGQARVAAIDAMMKFDTGGAGGAAKSGGLLDEIAELERSVPELSAGATPRASAQAAHAQAPAMTSPRGGIVGLSDELFALRRKRIALGVIGARTHALAAAASAMRKPLILTLREVNRRSTELTKMAGEGNLATVRESTARFQSLLQTHKAAVAALLPLSKALVVLQLYGQSISRWRNAVDQQSTVALHGLILRLAALASVIVLILIAALLWRVLAFRYVQDHLRRHQILQARRWAVLAVIVLVILFNFASELGSLATVLGFAAAGIALALQNVILSVAGYFFLIGRFGIKVGDRVQVGGVVGDVIDVGLVKLTLMELSGASNRFHSGRVVVFSNAIVFQPSGNFFKQAPGTNYTWNELQLTVSPDCDYRLAEKRLLDVVGEVYARYGDQIRRETHQMERSLNLPVETPKPQSRLLVATDGIKMLIRYPVDARSATLIADEVSRRVLDTIKRDPGLKLVTPGTANLEPMSPEDIAAAEAAQGGAVEPNGAAAPTAESEPAPSPPAARVKA